MAALNALAEAGFTNAVIVGTEGGTDTVRVRTSRGWVYERFASPQQVSAWVKKHQPEESE